MPIIALGEMIMTLSFPYQIKVVLSNNHSPVNCSLSTNLNDVILPVPDKVVSSCSWNLLLWMNVWIIRRLWFAFLDTDMLNFLFVIIQEIFSSWSHKTEHFQRIHSRTGVPFSSMLFFDDEDRNIEGVIH